LIQVYTGNGKGKTTAALGLALRAAGAGLRIYICQFVKGRFCSELRALSKFKNIKCEQFGAASFIKNCPANKDIKLANMGLAKIKKAIAGKKYDLIILDEINVALQLGLLQLKDVMGVIKKTPRKTELILTGRDAPAQILKAADLASDVKELKHYFKRGLAARRGIEF